MKAIAYALLLLVSSLAAYYGVDSNNTTVSSYVSGVETIEQAFQQQ